MRQHIHEVLANIPPEEVVPDGALEGIAAVEQQRIGLRLHRLLHRSV